MMEALKIDVQNDQEKKILLAFLDSLSYHYRIENDGYVLTDAEMQEMVKRKADFLEAKTTSRPWSGIKKDYQNPVV